MRVGVAFGIVLVEVIVVDDWCGDVVEDGSGDGDKVAAIIICCTSCACSHLYSEYCYVYTNIELGTHCQKW